MTQHKHKISIGKMLLALGILLTAGASLATPAFADEPAISFDTIDDDTLGAADYADNEYKICVSEWASYGWSDALYYVQANEECEDDYQEAMSTSGDVFVFNVPTGDYIVCMDTSDNIRHISTVAASVGCTGDNSSVIYPPEQTFRNNFTNCMVESYNNDHDTELEELTDAQIAEIETVGECWRDSVYYIHSLDKLTSLKELWISGDIKNETLDFSANQNLADIVLSRYLFWKDDHIYDNQCLNNSFSAISNINVSKNTELEHLIITYGNLSKIDLSNNKKLIHLEILCSNLSEIDLSNNTELTGVLLSGNNLKKLDLSKNTKLDEISVNGNKITEINFSDAAFEYVNLIDNDLQYVDLSNLPMPIYDEDEDSMYGLSVYLSKNKNLKIVAVPAAWEGKYTEEQIREILNLDEDQKDVIIHYGKLKAPNTGIDAITEAAKYVAIFALPAILVLAVISKRVVKRQSKKVRFSH